MRLILSAIVFIATVTTVFGARACTLIYAPVCGSDGITYANSCFLDAASSQDPSITFVKNGKCYDYIIVKREVVEEEYTVGDYKCPEISKHGACTEELHPVCASNGKTYPNRCGMCIDMYQNGEKLTLEYEGVCKQKHDEFPSDFCLPHYKTGVCNRIYIPVCGSDGYTYGNPCEFCYYMYKKQEEEGVELTPKYYGECEDNPNNNAVTFDDECADQPIHLCPTIYKPVCASDGKTYASPCFFCAEKRKLQKSGVKPDLTFVFNGECKKPTYYEAEFCRPQWKSGVCTMEYMPLCGSDGKTYGNKCTFCYAMYKRQESGNDLKVKRDGECQDEDVLVCPEYYKDTNVCTLEYSPICGYDGRTYPNECSFCSAQAKKKEQGIELDFFYHGQCYI